MDDTTPVANPIPQPTPPPLSIFEQWAERVSRILNEESGLVGLFVKHPTIKGNAREALIHGALVRILPSMYEIGTGQVIDAAGNISKQMDIIIARKDFPAFRFPDGSAQYLVESVIATIEVKSTLNKRTLASALNNCYSIGTLVPGHERGSLDEFLKNSGLRMGVDKIVQQQTDNGSWAPAPPFVHEYYRTFSYPETFIFSFESEFASRKAFKDAITAWLESLKKDDIPFSISNLPAIVACPENVAIRVRALEYDSIRRAYPMLVVADDDPNFLGSFITYLLLQIQRSVKMISNTSGLVPTLEHYLKPRSTTGEVIIHYPWPEK